MLYVIVDVDGDVTGVQCELCEHSMLAHDVDGWCDDCELYGGVCDASHHDTDNGESAPR
jgi:hypothetical protein